MTKANIELMLARSLYYGRNLTPILGRVVLRTALGGVPNECYPVSADARRMALAIANGHTSAAVLAIVHHTLV